MECCAVPVILIAMTFLMMTIGRTLRGNKH